MICDREFLLFHGTDMNPLKRIFSQYRDSSAAGRVATLAGIGAAMAGLALIVRHQTRKAEHENPPVGRFIDIDGVRLHYVERGKGPPLVLLHGNGTMIQDYELSGLLNM